MPSLKLEGSETWPRAKVKVISGRHDPILKKREEMEEETWTLSIYTFRLRLSRLKRQDQLSCRNAGNTWMLSSSDLSGWRDGQRKITSDFFHTPPPEMENSHLSDVSN